MTRNPSFSNSINFVVRIASISGTIYAPAADVKLTGTVLAGVTLGGAYVVNSLDVSGIGAINIEVDDDDEIRCGNHFRNQLLLFFFADVST